MISPHLQRCMKQARDYPNTATVDILIAAVEKESEQASNEIYRLRNVVEAQDKALIHWRRAYDEAMGRIQGRNAPVESAESYEASEALLNTRRGE